MSAFTPIPSLEQLDLEAFYDEIDRQEELTRCGQNEPPLKYPGFRNVTDEILRQIIADPQPTAFDNPQVMIDEAQAELERRHPSVPAGYIDTCCVKCKTGILIPEGTGVGLCRKCAGLLVA